ncbi:MAM and LDL-receptor class A domain-containing protein [Dermatophagoides pteronyssinus]|uniref:MAM and LDL-receptor class A domain-containing protein n=1 Tax=Dermatophagoides pteronyssinus TaxID=6956 RepID=A0ABQ8J5J0_DERPT|nr:MAM and LDL-receptor class A domain-containing protein [Dermatophagoides pteronyssinus]
MEYWIGRVHDVTQLTFLNSTKKFVYHTKPLLYTDFTKLPDGKIGQMKIISEIVDDGIPKIWVHNGVVLWSNSEVDDHYDSFIFIGSVRSIVAIDGISAVATGLLAESLCIGLMIFEIKDHCTNPSVIITTTNIHHHHQPNTNGYFDCQIDGHRSLYPSSKNDCGDNSDEYNCDEKLRFVLKMVKVGLKHIYHIKRWSPISHAMVDSPAFTITNGYDQCDIRMFTMKNSRNSTVSFKLWNLDTGGIKTLSIFDSYRGLAFYPNWITVHSESNDYTYQLLIEVLLIVVNINRSSIHNLTTEKPCIGLVCNDKHGKKICLPVQNICDFIEQCKNGEDEQQCSDCDFSNQTMCGWENGSNGGYVGAYKLQLNARLQYIMCPQINAPTICSINFPINLICLQQYLFLLIIDYYVRTSSPLLEPGEDHTELDYTTATSLYRSTPCKEQGSCDFEYMYNWQIMIGKNHYHIKQTIFWVRLQPTMSFCKKKDGMSYDHALPKLELVAMKIQMINLEWSNSKRLLMINMCNCRYGSTMETRRWQLIKIDIPYVDNGSKTITNKVIQIDYRPCIDRPGPTSEKKNGHIKSCGGYLFLTAYRVSHINHYMQKLFSGVRKISKNNVGYMCGVGQIQIKFKRKLPWHSVGVNELQLINSNAMDGSSKNGHYVIMRPHGLKNRGNLTANMYAPEIFCISTRLCITIDEICDNVND